MKKSSTKPKTQSQKIRNRIYVIWEMKGKTQDFESYYNRITDWFIYKLDKQIDQLESPDPPTV